MMIWDVHCHLSGVPGRTPDERMAQLIAFADRMGIERLCVFMGMNWSYDPTPDDMRKQNDEVLAALERWHYRAFGFVYLNPNHVEASLAELDPIVERARELKVTVLQHTYIKVTGNLPGESTPMELAELARRHPDVPFIAAHTGADWEVGIRAIRDCKNVSAELCGSDPTAGFTEMAVRELGAERVLYGSDAGGRSFASQLGKVLGADISESAKRLILSDNCKRLLMPILKQKGVAL